MNKEYDRIIYILEDYRSLMAEASSAEISLKLSIRDYMAKHHDDPKCFIIIKQRNMRK